jgi:hypothetical protein
LIGPSGAGAPPPANAAAEQNVDRVARATDLEAIEREQTARDREQAQRDREREQAQAEREASRKEREDQLYESGQDALEEAKWQRAVDRFSMVATAKMPRADAALYWKAYALDKLGQKAEALATAAEMMKTYPASRWMSDAKALELQVRQSVGQPVRPEAENDEELKLLALQGLQHSIPSRRCRCSRRFFRASTRRGCASARCSCSPRATRRKRGRSSSTRRRARAIPDLQRKAIQYLGVNGSRENREALAQIYESSTDVDVKRRILRSFAISGDRARVLAAATSETSPELRSEAVQQLGVMGAHEELWQLYQKESNVDVKKRIVQSMFVGGNSARLIELANNEQNVELKRTAIRNLGLMGSSKTSEALTALYAKEKDLDTRKAIVQAFFTQNNAEQLVAIARKETDPVMRKELVSRLSTMRSKVATDYLLEILNK